MSPESMGKPEHRESKARAAKFHRRGLYMGSNKLRVNGTWSRPREDHYEHKNADMETITQRKIKKDYRSE